MTDVPRLPAGASIAQYFEAVGVDPGSWTTQKDSPFAIPGHPDDRTGWTAFHHLIEDMRRGKVPAEFLAAVSRVPDQVINIIMTAKNKTWLKPFGLSLLA